MFIVQNIIGDVKPKLRQDSLYNQWRPWMSMSCHEHVRHLAQLCTWPTPSFWHHTDHAKDRVLHIHRTPITCRRNYPLPQYISNFTCPLCLWKIFFIWLASWWHSAVTQMWPSNSVLFFICTCILDQFFEILYYKYQNPLLEYIHCAK